MNVAKKTTCRFCGERVEHPCTRGGTPDECRYTASRAHGIVAEIKKHKDAIARHRDALRDIHNDLEGILESATTGIDALETAIDELSQYV